MPDLSIQCNRYCYLSGRLYLVLRGATLCNQAITAPRSGGVVAYTWLSYLVLESRLLVGAVLLASGIIKLRSTAAARQAIHDFRLLPAPGEQIFARLLPLAEVVIGFLLIFGLA